MCIFKIYFITNLFFKSWILSVLLFLLCLLFNFFCILWFNCNSFGFSKTLLINSAISAFKSIPINWASMDILTCWDGVCWLIQWFLGNFCFLFLTSLFIFIFIIAILIFIITIFITFFITFSFFFKQTFFGWFLLSSCFTLQIKPPTDKSSKACN